MARFTFKLPDIGEGIAEAEIVAWHVAVGDRVEEDQNIADMMTDKATVEMESPVAGTVVELAGEVGDQVAIGAALVVIETEGRGGEATRRAARREPEPRRAVRGGEPGGRGGTPTPPARAVRAAACRRAASRRRRASEPPRRSDAASAPCADARARAGDAGRETVLASPAVRARAEDLGVDLAQVKAEGDRVRHADLDAFLRYGVGPGLSGAARQPRARGRADQASSACAAASPRTWPRRSATSRISPMSTRST